MKNFILFCLTILFMSSAFAQSTNANTIEKINKSESLNEFLDLKASDQITDFSIAVVVDSKLTAYPFENNNTNIVFNNLKDHLNSLSANSSVKIIIIDLKYATDNDVISTDNFVYNVADLPLENTMASN